MALTYFFIIGGIIFAITGFVMYKFPDLDWILSLKRALYVKDGQPTEFYYSMQKFWAIAFMILGPVLSIAGTVDLIWGNSTTYDFLIDGKELSIPCDYDELKAIGYRMDSAEEGKILKAGDSSYMHRAVDENGKVIVIALKNRSSKDRTKAECDVISVYVKEENGPELRLHNGLTFGSDNSEIRKLLGTPDNKLTSSVYSNDYVVKKWGNTFVIGFSYGEKFGVADTIKVELYSEL